MAPEKEVSDLEFENKRPRNYDQTKIISELHH